jgi:hypothetical protein
VNDLEDAWAAVHETLPAGWTVGPTSHHSEERHRPWHVVAVDLRSRALPKEYVEATGWTEAEALRDLATLLGGWHVEEGRRARAAEASRERGLRRARTGESIEDQFEVYGPNSTAPATASPADVRR